MPVAKFSDIAKKAGDLLSDDFTFEKKVTLKTKTANGVTFTTDGNINGDAVLGKLAMKWSPVAGIQVKKLEVTTSDKITGQIELTDTGVKGLTFGAKAVADAKSETGTISAEYSDDAFSFSFEADAVAPKKKVTASAVAAFEGFTFGGSVVGDIDAADGAQFLKTYGASVGYAASDFEASVASKDKFKTFTGGYHQKFNSDINVATVASFGGDKGTAFAFGATCKLDGSSSVAGKLNQSGSLAALYKQQFASNVTLIACSELNVANLNDPKPKFGLGLTFQ